MEIRQREFAIPTPDGHVIRGTTWSADRPPKAHVQIAHGRSEYGRRYRPFAEDLVRAGYAVHANDHRGHGAAARDAGTLGDLGPGGFPALVDDMAILTRFIRAQASGAPVLLFGHSMGSFAGQYYLLDHSGQIDGLVLCGTSALDLRSQAGALASDFLAGIVAPRTPVDWLSRDPAVVDAYLADPLCNFDLTAASRTSMYADVQRTVEPASYAKIRKDLPIVLMTGDRDPVNQFLAWFDPLAARYRGFGFTDVSTHVWGGARHEPLNEVNRDEVIATLVAWFDRVSRPRTPQAR